jgi:hypothetical protein
MKGRQPFAINGRRTAVKEFKAAAIRYPKSNESPQTFSYARAGRPIDGRQGGGNRVAR